LTIGILSVKIRKYRILSEKLNHNEKICHFVEGK